MSAAPLHFDPYAILAALDRQRVAYVVIGAFARIIRGTEEVTHGLDVVPSLRGANPSRLALALDAVDARHRSGRAVALMRDLASGPVLALETRAGEIKVVAEPVGTRGYDDLRRQATSEPIGRGVRPSVASSGDLARMGAALGRERDREPLQQLRTLAELERGLHRGVER